MNDTQYQQLLEESEAFSRLSKDLQKKIMKSEGQEREQYMQIFVTERRGILAAQRELTHSHEETLRTFEVKAEQEKRKFLHVSEQQEREDEVEKIENMLDTFDS